MRRRPDVFQVNRLVLLIVTDRLVRQVDIDRTGDCVGNDERRRSQVVGFHLRVNAAFKVPVTGQYGGYRHIVVGDRFADFVRKRTGVPDASRAAVTGNVEAERFERLDQARFGQVLGDNQGARRQAAFDVARFTQTKGYRFLRNEAGADHYAWVRCIGTGRDSRNDDGACAHFADFAVRMRYLDDFADFLVRQAVSAFVDRCADDAVERFFHVRQFDAVLRTFRTGKARYDGSEVKLDHVAEYRIRRCVRAEHALRFIVSFDQCNLVLVAACASQVVQGFSVNREETDGCAVFRCHVRNGCAVGQADVGQTRAVELDELADNAFLAEHLRDGQRKVGRRSAFCERTR